MEKLKQSFRKSFRRKKSQNLTLSNVKQKQNCVETIGNIHNGKSYCQSDEATVRSAACSFQVKYLGACEVFDSRGMHVCESALQQLRLKKRATKAILYVTGDGLRLVDQQENRGLILDQTIEKVSFCAPDRSDDKSFAYICRDGTSKRWMCHGFLSIQDNVNGERLSHAVGCAFTICLEKKQLRDIEVKDKKDTQVKAITDNNFERIFESTPSHNQNGLQRNILEYASFRRQLSLVERKLDPQKAIIHNNPLKNSTNTSKFEANQIPIVNNHFKNTNNFLTNFNNVKNSDLQNDINSTTIKPRPVSNPSLFKRQGSIKAPISSINTTIFKRFNSLRVDLPLKNSFIPISAVNNEPIYEGTETCSTELINNDLSEEKPELLKNTNSFALTSNDFFSNNKDLDFETNKTLSTNNCFNNCDFDKNSKKADEWLSEVLASSCAKFSQNSLAISTVTSFQSNYNQHNLMQNNLSKTHSFDASFNKSRFVSKPPNQMLRNHVLPYSQSVNFQPTNYFASDSKNNSQFLSPTTKNEENNRIQSPNYVRHGSLNGRANLTKNNQTNIKFTENPKKNSAVRLSIEYQLLEETDAPLQSPSKVHLSNEADLDKKPLIEITNSTQNNIYNFNNTTLLTNEKNLHDTTIFGNKGNNTLTQVCSRTTPNTVLMIGKDPFDVQWSTEVLKNSARRKDSIEKSIKSFLLSSDTFLPQLNTQQTLTKPIFDSTDTSYSVTSNLNVFLPVTLANNTNPFYTN